MKKIAFAILVFACFSCGSIAKVSDKDAAQQFAMDQTRCVKGSVVLVGSNKTSSHTDWYFTSCQGSVTVRQSEAGFRLIR
ncbi:MAG: hypothetical protein LBG19_03760 [Prevotellaceae bacterium]|jgi:hypothetical protein|nr:hypothetical protein [Prevotellaceae bacterium]